MEDSSENDCSICLNPCKDLSIDLPLYNCTCIYYVHPECFDSWRHRTNTRRICIICREEAPIVRRQRIILFREIAEQIDGRELSCVKKICLCVIQSCLVFNIVMYCLSCLGFLYIFTLPLMRA